MRVLPAAVTALLLLPAPASAQERICQPPPPPKPEPTKAEKELAALEDYARQRKEFGFRSDIAYVRKLVKRGVWEYDVGYIPVTPRENEYLKLRDRLDLGERGYRYLRLHRDVDGGLSVEDNWPKEPYLLARFTKDVDQHLAALKRVARFPNNLRAKRVPYSERELDRVRDRVHDDDKALEAEGFHVQGSSYDTDKGVAEIEIATTRTDAEEYFRKRYGKRVKAIVVAPETTVLECSKTGSFQIAPDGMSVTVRFESGGGLVFERAEVTETADSVTIGVVVRGSSTFRTADFSISESPPIALSAPLGARSVIDIATGRRMLQRGPSPGEPPCPVRAEPTPLQQAIDERLDAGLPADPAYVQRRLNSRSRYTKAEAAWLRRRQQLADDDRVERYVREHADEFGGAEVVGPYPKGPYVVYRFTKHVARHAAAIKRRSEHPKRVRVERATYTESALRKLSERINHEAQAADGFLDGYGRAGFFVRGASARDQTVTVAIVTTRPDHAAWFATRYGPAVRTEVIGDRYECAASIF